MGPGRADWLYPGRHGPAPGRHGWARAGIGGAPAGRTGERADRPYPRQGGARTMG
ncbi:hypothetical protein GCM10027075_06540 [Streptomyces heilongjiangensis]